MVLIDRAPISWKWNRGQVLQYHAIMKDLTPMFSQCFRKWPSLDGIYMTDSMLFAIASLPKFQVYKHGQRK